MKSDSNTKPTRTEALIRSHPEYQALINATDTTSPSTPSASGGSATSSTSPGQLALSVEKSDLDFMVNVAQLVVLLLILWRVGQ